MTPDLWAALSLALLVALLIYAFGWQSCAWHRDRQARARQLAADQHTAADRGHLPAPVTLTRARYWPTDAGWHAADPERWYWPTPQGWQAAQQADVFTLRAREIANASDQIATLRAEVWAEEWRRQ